VISAPQAATTQTSTLARLAIAAAPELLRVADRMASPRAQQRRVEPVPAPGPPRVESIQLSEVEIDFSVPFVRRVTMRNASAWSITPLAAAVAQAVVEAETERSSGRLRKAGLVGITGAAALAAGLLAHYADQRIGGRGRIIDVPGRRRA
jgi:hypothetical protein